MTTSNYMPDVQVEVAFNAGYRTADADRVWTDVSAYVELEDTIKITRGRQDEQGEISPSALQLALDNSDGRFTAGLASSPYYPNVKLGRPIRVSGTPVGSTVRRRFVGYVDSWVNQWDGVAERAKTQVTASSRRARLGLGDERRSAVEEANRADDPIIYCTMGDAEGATSAADSSGNSTPLRVTGTGAAVIFGTATGPGADDLTAATLQGGQHLTAQPSGDFISGLGAFVNRTDAPAAAEVVFGFNNGAVEALITTAGTVELWALGTLIATSASITDGAYHQVFALNGANASSLYVDGALVGTAAHLLVSSFSSLSVYAGGGGGVATGTLTGVLAHVAVYGTSAPDAAQVAAIFAAGLTGHDGDTSDEWIARLAGWEGIPIAEQDLDTGEAVIDGLRTTGGTVIDLMSTVATTENGLVYDARDGNLVFRNRSHRYNAASGFTLDMAAQEVEADFQDALDRSGLINDVTASSTVETVPPARIVDTTSRDEYGTAQDSPELATADEDELTQAAGWRVNGYSEPRPRVPTLSVQLVALDLAKQEALLDADISTRLTVDNQPDNAPATTADYAIEGYEEEIGPESWGITFNVSDADVGDIFKLGDPVLGVLGAGNRLGW